jgi:hypothetical protein
VSTSNAQSGDSKNKFRDLAVFQMRMALLESANQKSRSPKTVEDVRHGQEYKLFAQKAKTDPPRNKELHRRGWSKTGPQTITEKLTQAMAETTHQTADLGRNE